MLTFVSQTRKERDGGRGGGAGRGREREKEGESLEGYTGNCTNGLSEVEHNHTREIKRGSAAGPKEENGRVWVFAKGLFTQVWAQWSTGESELAQIWNQ